MNLLITWTVSLHDLDQLGNVEEMMHVGGSGLSFIFMYVQDHASILLHLYTCSVCSWTSPQVFSKTTGKRKRTHRHA